MTETKIILSLDPRQYDALQKSLQLRGSDVKTELQRHLDQCYLEMVPRQKREEIAEAASAVPLSFLRLIAEGEVHCFQLDGAEVDTPEAAARLTCFLIDAPNTRPNRFEDLFPKRTPITELEYTARIFELLGFSEDVAGVFDIDLDAGTFSTLDEDLGWRTYSAATVCAISHDLEKSGIADKAQQDAFFRNLPYSKQTANPDRFSRLDGSSPIKAEDLDLLEFIVEDDGVIVFLVDVLSKEQDVFGVEPYVDEDSYFVFHAVYDTNTQQVSDVLDVSLMRSAETVEFVCGLPSETVEGLRQKMDEYCVTWSGKHLEELKESGESRRPPQTWVEMRQNL